MGFVFLKSGYVIDHQVYQQCAVEYNNRLNAEQTSPTQTTNNYSMFDKNTEAHIQPSTP